MFWNSFSLQIGVIANPFAMNPHPQPFLVFVLEMNDMEQKTSTGAVGGSMRSALLDINNVFRQLTTDELEDMVIFFFLVI